jgi:hypothetical protein
MEGSSSQPPAAATPTSVGIKTRMPIHIKRRFRFNAVDSASDTNGSDTSDASDVECDGEGRVNIAIPFRINTTTPAPASKATPAAAALRELDHKGPDAADDVMSLDATDANGGSICCSSYEPTEYCDLIVISPMTHGSYRELSIRTHRATTCVLSPLIDTLVKASVVDKETGVTTISLAPDTFESASEMTDFFDWLLTHESSYFATTKSPTLLERLLYLATQLQLQMKIIDKVKERVTTAFLDRKRTDPIMRMRVGRKHHLPKLCDSAAKEWMRTASLDKVPPELVPFCLEYWSNRLWTVYNQVHRYKNRLAVIAETIRNYENFVHPMDDATCAIHRIKGVVDGSFRVVTVKSSRRQK